MRRRGAANIAQAFESIRSDYAAAKASRYRRTRQGLQLAGSNADYHYRSETDFFKVMEYARDMDRNDAIVGQTVNRAVDNTVQDGFRLDVNCGDQALDTEWGARFREWADNPEQCDIAGENDFAAMQFLTMRHVLVDGDMVS